MNNPGATADNPFDLLTRTRTVLLDALEALVDHRDVVIIVGAQAVYLHTKGVEVAIAEATKDSDVMVDIRDLGGDPTINEAMERANFVINPTTGQPGAWLSPDGIPVDIMVPEAIAPGKGKRSVDQPPHDKKAMRRARGLEAAAVDNSEMVVRSLTEDDSRSITAKVAGPAALIIAKCHKIHERVDGPVNRLKDKDAHDIYRILRAFEPDDLAPTFTRLLAEEISAEVTSEAIVILQNLFADGPDATGSVMAGRTEEGVGDPEQVSAAISILAKELVEAIRRPAPSEARGKIPPMTSEHQQQQQLIMIRDEIVGELQRGGAQDDLAYAVASGASANQTLTPAQVAALNADFALVQKALDGAELSDEEFSRLNSHIGT